MTNEEAIKVLTEQLAYSDDVLPARLKEAYEVAINSIKNSRADAIDECIEILKGTSRRNCSHILDEIVYRTVEQMENLKEQKE